MHINELSILVAAILSVAVGTIWYSPLLWGTRFSGGKTIREAESVPYSKKMIAETVVHISFAAVFFYVLSEILMIAANYEISLRTIVMALTALIIAAFGIHTVRERGSYIDFILHACYFVIIMLSGSAVLILWPW